VDPQCFDADPDPAQNLNADPDPDPDSDPDRGGGVGQPKMCIPRGKILGTPLRKMIVFCAPRLLTELYKQETEIRCRNDDGFIRNEQTSIATVRYNLRTLASFSTPHIFHWSLPLTELNKKKMLTWRAQTERVAGC
jgi:hypothetical protein